MERIRRIGAAFALTFKVFGLKEQLLSNVPRLVDADICHRNLIVVGNELNCLHLGITTLADLPHCIGCATVIDHRDMREETYCNDFVWISNRS